MGHPDLDRLLDYSLGFGQQLLKKRGAFYPFAAMIQPDGELKALAIHLGDETPQPQVVIDQFSELLKTLALNGEAVATALCYDSLVSAVGDEKERRMQLRLLLNTPMVKP